MPVSEGNSAIRALLNHVEIENNSNQAELLKSFVGTTSELTRIVTNQRKILLDKFIECAKTNLITNFDSNIKFINYNYNNPKAAINVGTITFELKFSYKHPSLNGDWSISFNISKQKQNSKDLFYLKVNHINTVQTKNLPNILPVDIRGVSIDVVTKRFKSCMESYMSIVNIPVHAISAYSMMPIPTKFMIDDSMIKYLYDPFLVIQFTEFTHSYPNKNIQQLKYLEDNIINSLSLKTQFTNHPNVIAFIKIIVNICTKLEYQNDIIKTYHDLYPLEENLHVNITVAIFMCFVPEYIAKNNDKFVYTVNPRYQYLEFSFRKIISFTQNTKDVYVKRMTIRNNENPIIGFHFDNDHEHHISNWLAEFFKVLSFPIPGPYNSTDIESYYYTTVTKDNPLHFNFDVFASNPDNANDSNTMQRVINQCASNMFENASLALMHLPASAGKPLMCKDEKYFYNNRHYKVQRCSGRKYILVQRKKMYID